MPDYIDKTIIRSDPMVMEEDVEKITFFPQTGDLEVVTYKRYYNNDKKLIKTEPGETVVIKAANLNILDDVRRAVRRKRGRE